MCIRDRENIVYFENPKQPIVSLQRIVNGPLGVMSGLLVIQHVEMVIGRRQEASFVKKRMVVKNANVAKNATKDPPKNATVA